MDTLQTYTHDHIQVPAQQPRGRIAESVQEDEEDGDALRAARGIALAVVLGSGLWGLILAAAWLIFH